jgi:tetratricopeptide (TPR) repeat protein
MMVAAMIVLNTLLLAVVAGLVAFLLRQGHEGVSSTALALALMDRSRPAAGATTRPAAPNANDYLADLDAPVAALALKDLPSWAQAEQAFAARDFKTALDGYGRLLLASRCLPTETTSGEFFKFRIAESVWSLGRPEAAQKLLNQLTAAESPVVRGAACAALAEMAESAGELLQARALAYRAVAALGALGGSLSLEADCDYLAGRALTKKVNALYASQAAVPWSRLQRSDPFAGSSEPAIRRLLEEGAAAGRSARGASAGVKIEKAGSRWRVSATKSTAEDVLNQFAVAAEMNVRWPAGDTSGRRRTVEAQLREMSAQRVAEVVCGMVGLAARFSPDHVTVCDVAAAGELQEQQAALGGEEESAWRRFALRYAGDERVGEGCFALAVLQEWAGEKASALRQYQFVAKQYTSQGRISPEALLRSAAIRTELRDYVGAERDLLDLLDVFPHYPRSAEVYIRLGRLKSLVGKHAEALTLFSRVLTFELTSEGRRETMLAAAECCFQKGDYDAACRWVGDCLAQPAELTQEQIVEGCGRLGQYESARGDHRAAVQAYRRALMANPSRGKYVELVLGVARSHQAGGDAVGALRMLGRLNGEDMAPDRLADWLMQLSAAYRAMGLPDRARQAIRKRGGAVTDAARQARLVMEQARCLWEEGDLVAARQAMAEALAKLGGGEEARVASLDLGELCLRMGDAAEAIVVAEDVLRGKCGDEQRRRALELMGRAHMARREYEKAVRALSAMAEVKMAAADGAKGGHK